ncbi:receptor-transporting protein 3 [Bos indicus x Bos taurus]|nr:receptor-transporting protein 3 [Bos indicus x Bos taurus]XP_027378405.1 receptor-transporting protein 3 [Bos indicus x Bos taurus]XP_027378406.1 receptor-transporting protein 3 [Bos indicus x Bos taurus]XP_027378407.1 receptor-transporting protein 3 [Bos indicus x Bos taurus]
MDLDMKVWKRVFQELIQEVKPCHTWQLTLDKSLLPNILKPGWAQYQQRTFARFQCSLCSRNWASAQVQVLFHMHWSEGESRGQVKMRVFAQRCQKCSQPSFEVPEFTEENISRILNNLVLQILKKCYREGIKFVKSPMIKAIALKGPHNSDNCEACLQGVCVQNDIGLAVQSPVALSFPTVSSPTLGITAEMPSPTSGSTRGEAVMKKKVLPRSWFPEPTPAESLPTSWSPRMNTSFQRERRDQDSSCDQSFYSHPAQHPRSTGIGCCCFILTLIVIIIIIVAVIVVAVTIRASKA